LRFKGNASLLPEIYDYDHSAQLKGSSVGAAFQGKTSALILVLPVSSSQQLLKAGEDTQPIKSRDP